jgi:hypothetical protein
VAYFKVDWRVAADEADGLADIDVTPATEVPWTMGVPWAAGLTIPDPLEFNLDENAGSRLPDAFLVTIPLFSPRMLGALASAGVDNFTQHNAVLIDPRTGKRDATYRAVNVLGVISCADLAKSKFDPTFAPPSMLFHHLVIDEARAHGQSFFRLAEEPSYLLANDRVAKALRAANLAGVRVISLDDLAGV